MGRPEKLTSDEHEERFSQGAPVGKMPPYPSRLVLMDIQDHVAIIGRTAGEYYGRDYSSGEVIVLKNRFVNSLKSGGY